MLTTSIILFAAAAIFGLLILIPLLQNKQTPKPAVFIHGALAATALIILIIFTINTAGDSPIISIVLFIIAALGGFTLAYRDLILKKPGPKGLAVIHAVAAVTGFLILLFFAFE